MSKFFEFSRIICGDDGTTDRKELFNKVVDRLKKDAEQEHNKIKKRLAVVGIDTGKPYADAADYCVDAELERKIKMAIRLYNEV